MAFDELSTDPVNFGIDQPPDQGSQELAAVNQGLGAQNVSDPFAGLANFAAMSKAKADNENIKVPFAGITLNPDGTISFKNVDPDVFRDLMQSRDFQRQTLGGFAQEAAKIHTELKRAQSQPWQQLGTALAANMANQPGMPGWVRGLGQTAAQMNPTVDQLRAQYLGTMGQGTQIAGQMVNQNIALRRVIQEGEAATESRKSREAKEATQLENQLDDNFRLSLDKEAKRAETTRQFDDSTVARIQALGKQYNRTPERVIEAISAVQSAQLGGRAAYDEKITEAERIRTENVKDREALMKSLQGYVEGRFGRQLDQQNRTQAFTAVIGELKADYAKSTFTGDDRATLQGINQSEEMFDTFLEKHKAAGGPLMGRLAGLRAFFGDKAAQDLINAQATQNIKYLASQGGISFARISENEGKMLFAQLANAVTNGTLAEKWINRFKKWNDDQRLAMLATKYAGNIDQIRDLLPAGRKDWDAEAAKIEKGLDPLKKQVKNLPAIMGELMTRGQVPEPGNKSGPKLAPFLDETGTQRTAGGKPVFVKEDGSLIFEDGSPVPKRK